MKLLVNALSARQGGGQTYINNMIEFVPDHYDVTLLVSTDFFAKSCTGNINIVNIGWIGRNPFSRVLVEFFYLLYLIRVDKFDAIFCPGGVSYTYFIGDVKMITMFRNVLPFENYRAMASGGFYNFLRHFVLKYLMINTMNRADLVVFISNYAKELVSPYVRPKKSVVIYHGINTSFRSEPSDASLSSDYILYVSKFIEYKHQDVVIEAYSGLSSEYINSYKLVLVGETAGDYFKKCKSLVDKLNLSHRIEFTGEINNSLLPNLYKNSFFNIFASSCENCPNIMLEALASNRPLICSGVMPMPEFGGEDIIYFDPRDSEELRNSMIRLLTDSKEVIHQCSVSRERQSCFSWDRTAQKTWSEIKQL